jgi:hypothetical protein
VSPDQDELVARAHAWIEEPPEGDVFELAAHIGAGQRLMAALVALADELDEHNSDLECQ